MANTRTEPGLKRVRVYLGGRLAADSRHPVLVWEKPYYPTYYLPEADVLAALTPVGTREDGAAVHDVTVDGASAPGAAVVRAEPGLRDLVRLEFEAMDEWLEEDEPIYVHPRDPYKRVDVLASSRHVVVELDGVVVADSRQPRVLFETGLPPRYYLPPPDVRTDLLVPSATTTRCPYKGTATYWSVHTGAGRHEDVVWTYRSPLAESQKVTGLVCFYDEKVDLTVDGERQERPRTPFS